MLRLQLFNWHFYKFIIWISLVPYLTGMVKLHNRSLLGRWNKPECSHLNVVCTPESTGSCWSELVDCILRLLFRNRKVLSWGLRLTAGYIWGDQSELLWGFCCRLRSLFPALCPLGAEDELSTAGWVQRCWAALSLPFGGATLGRLLSAFVLHVYRSSLPLCPWSRAA